MPLDQLPGNALPVAFNVEELNVFLALFFPSGALADRNGVNHERLAEAFDTTRNVIILLYPVLALTKTTIICPPDSSTDPATDYAKTTTAGVGNRP